MILAHGDLVRTGQVVRHLSAGAVPVALHVDRRSAPDATSLDALRRLPGVTLLPRTPSRWGSWGLVEASLAGSRTLFADNPGLGHVCLLSGACLPLRPAEDLRRHLAARPGRDFIESVRIDHADWVVAGLQAERFRLRFPFRFRDQPRLFDLATRAQRSLPRAFDRRLPAGLEPCLGAQWWCLSRRTLEAILADPDLPRFRRWFRCAWIPDEAFFQTLVRRHSDRIEARSLTFAPFDSTGRPVTFYDDHLPLLRRLGGDWFFARKIWPGADRLYADCLGALTPAADENGAVASALLRALRRPPPRQPAIPRRDVAPGHRPYRVVYGADALLPGLAQSLRGRAGRVWIGPVFGLGPCSGLRTAGGLSASDAVARANPAAYLANLLRDAPAEAVLVLGPDAPEEAAELVARDPLARLIVVEGGWIAALAGAPGANAGRFADWQRAERRVLPRLTAGVPAWRLGHWTLQEALDRPDEVLAALGLPADALPMPPAAKLTAFLDRMRAEGLNPATLHPPAIPARSYRRDWAAEPDGYP